MNIMSFILLYFLISSFDETNANISHNNKNIYNSFTIFKSMKIISNNVVLELVWWIIYKYILHFG